MPINLRPTFVPPVAGLSEIRMTHGVGTSDGEGDGWMVELPAVIALARAAENGEIGAGEIASTLLAAIRQFFPESGCCPQCEEAIPSYAAALREYGELIEAQKAADAAMTPESHPFALSSSGKVHRWDCTSKLHQTEYFHPGQTLQEYVHGPSRGGIYWTPRSSGHSVRVTADELAAQLRGRSADRCKRCTPSLPTFTSEASDVEATGRV